MKKIITLTLVLAMVLVNVALPAMAEEGFADIKGTPYEEAVNALAGQGIVNGRAEGVYAPQEGLTRAEMVTIILRAYGSEEVEPKAVFEDVPESHWAYKYVETAYKMGIVNGMSETIFAPDQKVTFEQAVKMLVCAEGKEEEATGQGGWPDGYIAVASKLGVLEGITTSKGEEINRGVMAQMVYNCLNLSKGQDLDYMINWDGVAEHYNWIRDGKLRGIYGHSPQTYEDETGVYARLEKAGVNTIFLNINDGPQSGTKDGWKEGCAAAIKNLEEKYHFHNFIKINFGDNGIVPNTLYGQFHPGLLKASYTNTPCPLQEGYWEEQLIERATYIAGFESIEGIILDFEMYSGGASSYTSSCMCNSCWEKYIVAKKYKGKIATCEDIERSELLVKEGKIDEYNEWFEDELVKLFAKTREAIHEVNPKIIIGYFPAFDWIPGMTEGLGTPERPVLVASEAEYHGSLADTETTMRLINESEELHAIYLPGIFPGKQGVSAEVLEKTIKLAAPTTAGYWMYAAQTLAEIEENYAAVENANKHLDEEIANGNLTPLPEYEIVKYSAKKIKGKTPTEDEWKAADVTAPFVDYRLGDEAERPVETEAKILYSDDNIFVRIRAYDDAANILEGSKMEHDSSVWGSDCVEFFWRFDGTSAAGQLCSNLAGSLWDGLSTGIITVNSSINFEGFESESKILKDGWEMTMTIPGALDGARKIQQGDTLRMQIGRYHKATANAGKNANFCWAVTYGSYLASPSLWGYVTLD